MNLLLKGWFEPQFDPERKETAVLDSQLSLSIYVGNTTQIFTVFCIIKMLELKQNPFGISWWEDTKW